MPTCLCWSLSARRAWIEIGMGIASNFKHTVALRKESVDRNIRLDVLYNIKEVALRKESVDRNAACTAIASKSDSRSPQGERG